MATKETILLSQPRQANKDLSPPLHLTAPAKSPLSDILDRGKLHFIAIHFSPPQSGEAQ